MAGLVGTVGGNIGATVGGIIGSGDDAGAETTTPDVPSISIEPREVTAPGIDVSGGGDLSAAAALDNLAAKGGDGDFGVTLDSVVEGGVPSLSAGVGDTSPNLSVPLSGTFLVGKTDGEQSTEDLNSSRLSAAFGAALGAIDGIDDEAAVAAGSSVGIDAQGREEGAGSSLEPSGGSNLFVSGLIPTYPVQEKEGAMPIGIVPRGSIGTPSDSGLTAAAGIEGGSVGVDNAGARKMLRSCRVGRGREGESREGNADILSY